MNGSVIQEVLLIFLAILLYIGGKKIPEMMGRHNKSVNGFNNSKNDTVSP